MSMTDTQATITLDSQHEDMIHDIQMDFSGKKLASCSSDRTIRLFSIEEGEQKILQVLTGHEGPIWQLSWAHPKFGTILASCSYDAKVRIWKEQGNNWTCIKEHEGHSSSVNSVCWAPHEMGPILAAASSDGKVSILSFKEDNTWESLIFDAHAIGVNAVSWASAISPGSLFRPISSNNQDNTIYKKFVTAGCDNLVKIWTFNEETKSWMEEVALEGHSDWVRDVAWAPNVGLLRSQIASCSQDKTVIIWTQDNPQEGWNKHFLKPDKFPDVVWRVSWNPSAILLAVSSGDNVVSLWREKNVEGKMEWECCTELNENS